MPDDALSAVLDAIRAENRSLETTNTPSWGTVPKISRVIAGSDRLLAAVDAVLKLHSEWQIYEECDHPRILDSDYGCPDCYCYSICRSCCAGGGSGQTEQCASDHDVVNCWPCATYRDLSRELLGEDAEA